MVSVGSASTWSGVERLLAVKEKTNLKLVCPLVNPYGDLHRRRRGDLDGARLAFWPSSILCGAEPNSQHVSFFEMCITQGPNK